MGQDSQRMAPLPVIADFFVDLPARGNVVRSPQTTFQCWVSTGAGDLVRSADLRIGNVIFPVQLGERTDVAAVYPHNSNIGLRSTFPIDALLDGAGVELELRFDAASIRLPIEIAVDEDAAAEFAARKRRKLRLIRSIIRCVRCEKATFTEHDQELICGACGARFPQRRGAFEFIDNDLRKLAAAESTESISSNAYDAEAYALVNQFRDGLILDAGSGLRKEYLANVVNFEIVEFATTDVIGICERLPFQDASFDAVFSFAVLEHVRDPFQSARELVRVLKPGGTLYAAVPFLQPFHGYPNHFYNMTSSGLRNLFPDLFVEKADVPPYGLPIWTLAWLLRSWAAALPSDVADSFREMRVADLVGNPLDYLAEPFVAQLPTATNDELACVNRLIARKPL